MACQNRVGGRVGAAARVGEAGDRDAVDGAGVQRQSGLSGRDGDGGGGTDLERRVGDADGGDRRHIGVDGVRCLGDRRGVGRGGVAGGIGQDEVDRDGVSGGAVGMACQHRVGGRVGAAARVGEAGDRDAVDGAGVQRQSGLSGRDGDGGGGTDLERRVGDADGGDRPRSRRVDQHGGQGVQARQRGVGPDHAVGRGEDRSAVEIDGVAVCDGDAVGVGVAPGGLIAEGEVGTARAADVLGVARGAAHVQHQARRAAGGVYRHAFIEGDHEVDGLPGTIGAVGGLGDAGDVGLAAHRDGQHVVIYVALAVVGLDHQPRRAAVAGRGRESEVAERGVDLGQRAVEGQRAVAAVAVGDRGAAAGGEGGSAVEGHHADGLVVAIAVGDGDAGDRVGGTVFVEAWRRW